MDRPSPTIVVCMVRSFPFVQVRATKIAPFQLKITPINLCDPDIAISQAWANLMKLFLYIHSCHAPCCLIYLFIYLKLTTDRRIRGPLILSKEHRNTQIYTISKKCRKRPLSVLFTRSFMSILCILAISMFAMLAYLDP